MNKLITKGNLAIFEYPPVKEPEFTIDKEGVLFIFGYKMHFSGSEVGTARRFDLKLKNYTLVGKYDYAKTIVQGDFSEMLQEDVDTDNCLVLIKKSNIQN